MRLHASVVRERHVKVVDGTTSMTPKMRDHGKKMLLGSEEDKIDLFRSFMGTTTLGVKAMLEKEQLVDDDVDKLFKHRLFFFLDPGDYYPVAMRVVILSRTADGAVTLETVGRKFFSKSLLRHLSRSRERTADSNHAAHDDDVDVDVDDDVEPTEKDMEELKRLMTLWKVDGEQAEGKKADGEQADGEQANGEQVDGMQADGMQADGKQADGDIGSPTRVGDEADTVLDKMIANMRRSRDVKLFGDKSFCAEVSSYIRAMGIRYDRKPLVVIGNGKSSGRATSPSAKVIKHLAQNHMCMFSSEYGSSKFCPCCLVQFKSKDAKSSTSLRTKVCTTNDCDFKGRWNRDDIAPLTIAVIFVHNLLGWTLPDALTPPSVLKERKAKEETAAADDAAAPARRARGTKRTATSAGNKAKHRVKRTNKGPVATDSMTAKRPATPPRRGAKRGADLLEEDAASPGVPGRSRSRGLRRMGGRK